MRNPTLLLAAAVLPVLVGCSMGAATEKEKSGTTSSAIQGGALDNNPDHSFAVGIAYRDCRQHQSIFARAAYQFDRDSHVRL